jgi:hypothetical protein
MRNQQRSFFKSRTWITLLFLFGIVLLLIGLAEILSIPADARDNMAVPFVTFGFILVFLAGARLYRDGNGPLQDERTRKIGAYGLAGSWFLTFLLLFIFFWLDHFDICQPDAGTPSVMLILFMGVICKDLPVLSFQERRCGMKKKRSIP